MIILLAFLLSLFATMVMTPPLIFLAKRYGFVDIPNHRKVHKLVVPRIGGLAFYLGSMLPILLWCEFGVQELSYVVGGFVIIVFGLADDRLELDFKVKFLGQLLGAGVVIFFGGIQIQDMPAFMGGAGLPGYISIPLTVFVLLAVTNAVNFSDGLDGLAGGVVLVSLVVIGLIAFEAGWAQITLISIALAGGVLGFLQFNGHPAKLFMGDGGSQFLGFSVAVLAIWLTQAEFSPYAASVPLLLVGMPLVDIVMVTLNRKLDGKSAFVPDKTHLHHRMLSMGLDHLEAVVAVYFLQVMVVVTGYFFRFSSDFLIVGTFGFILVVYLMISRKAEFFNRLFRPKSTVVGASSLTRRINYLRKEGGVAKVACFYIVLTLSGYYAYSLVLIESDSFLLSASLIFLFFSIIIIRLYVKNRFTEMYERVCFYTVAVIFMFSLSPEVIESSVHLGVFLVLGLVVLIGMHYTRDGKVKVRPGDVLVLLLVLILPRFFSSFGLESYYGLITFYLIVLFYAIELLLVTSTYHCGQQKYIKLGLIMPMLLLGLQGL